MISGPCYGRGIGRPTKYIEFSENREEGHGVTSAGEEWSVHAVSRSPHRGRAGPVRAVLKLPEVHGPPRCGFAASPQPGREGVRR